MLVTDAEPDRFAPLAPPAPWASAGFGCAARVRDQGSFMPKRAPKWRCASKAGQGRRPQEHCSPQSDARAFQRARVWRCYADRKGPQSAGTTEMWGWQPHSVRGFSSHAVTLPRAGIDACLVVFKIIDADVLALRRIHGSTTFSEANAFVRFQIIIWVLRRSCRFDCVEEGDLDRGAASSAPGDALLSQSNSLMFVRST